MPQHATPPGTAGAHLTTRAAQAADAAASAAATATDKATQAVQAATAVTGRAREAVTTAVTTAVGEATAVLKPRLRGWIHATTAPLALATGLVLTALAPTSALTWACALYTACSLLLFAGSGTYHLGNGHWPAPVSRALQRLDHANIYLLIAGTYTPLSLALLPAPTARLVLALVWGGAGLGITLRLAWPRAPRWLSTLTYVLLGWVALWFLPSFWRAGGPVTVWLLVAGGLAYTLGALVYARRHPDPWPTWFGFHEVFHALTVAAWACHAIACYLAALGPHALPHV